MYKNNKILGIITARGGSKGIPRKNIIALAGKPLIAWTIQAGRNSKYLDRMILSSDSDEIINVAHTYGCEAPFKRPKELANDNTSSMDVILHALNSIDGSYTHFVLLQPTSPLRNATHIDCMIEAFFENNVDYMVSVKKSKKHPSYMYQLVNNKLLPFLDNDGHQLRRQDMPASYEHNGAIYIANIEKFKSTPSFNHLNVGAFEMTEEESLDIDNNLDIIIAEAILKN